MPKPHWQALCKGAADRGLAAGLRVCQRLASLVVLPLLHEAVMQLDRHVVALGKMLFDYIPSNKSAADRNLLIVRCVVDQSSTKQPTVYLASCCHSLAVSYPALCLLGKKIGGSGLETKTSVRHANFTNWYTAKFACR